jgi:hypothetical protein
LGMTGGGTDEASEDPGGLLEGVGPTTGTESGGKGGRGTHAMGHGSSTMTGSGGD